MLSLSLLSRGGLVNALKIPTWFHPNFILFPLEKLKIGLNFSNGDKEKVNIRSNPLIPHDALKHHFKSLKQT